MSTPTEGPKTPTSIATPKMKRGLKGYIAETKREMKKVIWPSNRETTRLTFVVLCLVIFLAIMLSAMGYVADVMINVITKGKV